MVLIIITVGEEGLLPILLVTGVAIDMVLIIIRRGKEGLLPILIFTVGQYTWLLLSFGEERKA